MKHVVEMGESTLPVFPVIFQKPWSSIVYEPNPIKLVQGSMNEIEHEGFNKLF
jgi:2-keto-4-pentenoate hydratase/2-oxohepta-3-ene-1,7-dioic acid hydratase in catechol pathway